MFLLKIISRLPFSILYALADSFFVVLFYLVSYRKKVVFDNLRKSFPEKAPQEIRAIAKGFYKNLIDVMLETVKLLTISEKELRKRVVIDNPEVIMQFRIQDRPVVVLTSHQCNWEWLLVSCSLQLDYPVDGVYLRLTNSFSDHLMLAIRSRFGANMIEKKDLFKSLITKKNIARIIAMVGDQAPKHDAHVLWTNFLHQETNFFTGGERIAIKMNMPILYVEMRRLKRGHYAIAFEVLSESPKESQKNEITEKFVRAMEKTIHQYPSDWLWSHKRWKYAYKRQLKDLTAEA